MKRRLHATFYALAGTLAPTGSPPSGIRATWWEPTWTKIFPPHHANLTFFLQWLLSRLRVFKNKHYAVLIIEDELGSLVHRTCVFPAWWQFPFMRPQDVQFGNIFTAPQWRRRGVAAYAVALCLERVNKLNSGIYYIAEISNFPSHELALKSGFLRVGWVRKIPSTKLGIYAPVSSAESEKLAYTDFSSVTELAGEPVSQLQIFRLVQRYVWAADRCADRDVLDVACGSGAGMELFATKARCVVGGDIDEGILRHAARHYGDRFTFYRFDAEQLPFANGSFDVITIFEAIYYLPNPDRFFAECRRVLRTGGKLLISTANKDLYDFTRSSFSTNYFNPPELSARLAAAGFAPQFFGGEPVGPAGSFALLMRWLRFIAGRIGVIPKSMRGKRFLRRLVFGALQPMPAELTGREAEYRAPVPIPASQPDRTHRILYCAAEAGHT